MTNEIVLSQSNAILKSMDDVERAARAMAASGFFQDTKQLSQAIVKIMAGQELGFGAFASMTGVHIIQNKPTLAANLMAAAVKRTGKYNYRVTEMSNEACEITFYEGGQEVGKSRFTKEDATAAGLWGKENWKKYPRNMLFARALSNGQKWYAPDVFNGVTVYTPDELGAVTDEDGNVVDAQVAHAQPFHEMDTAQDAEAQNQQEISHETYRYNDAVITQTIARIAKSKAEEVAPLIYQAVKDGKLAKELTISDAEAFAKHINI